MPDKKSKHRDERKRKRSRSREHSNDKEGKRSRNEKREEERRSRHERKDKADKESDRRVKEEKEPDKRVKDERDKEKRGREEESERRHKDEDGGSEGLGQERLSLSIEETNKIRAKLGLKPLQTDDKKDGGGVNEEGVKKEKKEDVHKPAINMADLKKTAELKEKLAQMKEKRKNEALFSKIKPIACDDEEEDGDVESVLNWVSRSRKIEEVKKKQVEEEKITKEFGIDKLVKKELGVGVASTYSSRDLRGLKIEHDSERFKEGKDVILTLKDKGVLDEKDDVLVNVNMVDDEAAEENTENRKKKLDYNPYEDLEYDEHGNPRDQSVLSKYDDEIRGSKLKKAFTIGAGTTSEHPSNHHSNSTNKHMQSLVLPKPVLVSEYFTPQELELSGKPRKVKAKKIRKKVKLTADDLLNSQDHNTAAEATTSTTTTATSSKTDAKANARAEASIKKEIKKEGENGGKNDVKIEVKMEEDDDDDEKWDPYSDLSGVVIEDDGVDIELEMAIKKASRINFVKKRSLEAAAAAVAVKEEPEEMEEGKEMDFTSSGIVLNATAEYCRSLGDVPISIEATTTTMMMHEEDGGGDDDDDAEERVEGGLKGWQSVDMEEGEVVVKEEDTHVLDEEPILNKGVGAALMLASKKGYLNNSNSKAATARVTSNLEAKNYSIEDKRVDDDDKYRNKRDRYSNSGPIMPFREKEGYDPDVKLEYIDDLGREMSKKEAFRYLSHQFHGKGSGLKKCEKRMKKEKEDIANRTLTSETPLTTVQMLQEKQKHSKLPYVILGSSKAKN